MFNLFVYIRGVGTGVAWGARYFQYRWYLLLSYLISSLFRDKEQEKILMSIPRLKILILIRKKNTSHHFHFYNLFSYFFGMATMSLYGNLRGGGTLYLLTLSHEKYILIFTEGLLNSELSMWDQDISTPANVESGDFANSKKELLSLYNSIS